MLCWAYVHSSLSVQICGFLCNAILFFLLPLCIFFWGVEGFLYAKVLRAEQDQLPTSLWVYRNLFWQLSRDGNLHCFGMLHAMTACPKPSFMAPWKVGDSVVSRGNAGWTTSKSRHIWSAHARTGQKGLLQKRLEEDLCWIIPRVSPLMELNWTEPV